MIKPDQLMNRATAPKRSASSIPTNKATPTSQTSWKGFMPQLRELCRNTSMQTAQQVFDAIKVSFPKTKLEWVNETWSEERANKGGK